MSAAAMEAVAGIQGLKGSPRLVAFALAWSTPEKSSFARATLAKLAGYAGLSEVQARRILQNLEQTGWIRRAEWNGRAVTWELTFMSGEKAGNERADLSPHERARNDRAALSPDERADLSPHETHRKEKEKSLRSAQRARARGAYSVNDFGITFAADDRRDQDCLSLISSHPDAEVKRAVATARAAEFRGRAFPSAVLKILQGGRVCAAVGNTATARDYLNKRMREITRESMVIDV